MQVEKPIEIKTDWNDALKGLGYTCGGLSVGLAGLIEGVSLVKNGEHADPGAFVISGVAGLFYGALVWADTYSLRDKQVYKNWPYTLVEQSTKEATLFQLQENV